jgi:hypothetical protein
MIDVTKALNALEWCKQNLDDPQAAEIKQWAEEKIDSDNLYQAMREERALDKLAREQELQLYYQALEEEHKLDEDWVHIPGYEDIFIGWIIREAEKLVKGKEAV